MKGGEATMDGRAASFIRTFQLPGSDRGSPSSFVYTRRVREAHRTEDTRERKRKREREPRREIASGGSRAV